MEYAMAAAGQHEDDDTAARRGGPGPGRHSLISPTTLALIVDLRVGGASLAAVATALNREGVPRPQGGRRWRSSSIHAVLNSRRGRALLEAKS